jgi:hypothetical protein
MKYCLYCFEPVIAKDPRKILHGSQGVRNSCAWHWQRKKQKENYDNIYSKRKEKATKEANLRERGYDSPSNGDDSWMMG